MSQKDIAVALFGTSRSRTEFYDLTQFVEKAMNKQAVGKLHADLHVRVGNWSMFLGWASCESDVDGERDVHMPNHVFAPAPLLECKYNSTVSHLESWLLNTVMCQRQDQMSFVILSVGACEIRRGKLALYQQRVTQIIRTTKRLCASTTKVFWKTEETTHDIKFTFHNNGFSDVRMSQGATISRTVAKIENIEIIDTALMTQAATDFTRDGAHYYACDEECYYGNEVSRSIALLIHRRIRYALNSAVRGPVFGNETAEGR